MSVTIAFAEVLNLPGMPKSRRGVHKLLKRIGAHRVRHGLYQLDNSALVQLSDDARLKLLSSPSIGAPEERIGESESRKKPSRAELVEMVAAVTHSARVILAVAKSIQRAIGD